MFWFLQSDGRLEGRLSQQREIKETKGDDNNNGNSGEVSDDDDNGSEDASLAAITAIKPPKIKPDPASPDNHSIRFVVIRKPRNHHTRIWEQDPTDVVADSRGSSVATIRPQREVTKGSIIVDPKYSYFVIPFTLEKDTPSRFCIRIFSEGDLKVLPVEDTYSLLFTGGFRRKPSSKNGGNITRGDSAGGPLLDKDRSFNAEWCQNPQYMVYIPPDRSAPTNIKVVLRRTGQIPKGTKNKPVPKLGLVACKNKLAQAQPKRRMKKQPNKLELLSDRPLDGTAILPGRPLPPKPMPNRRLTIDFDEWATVSEFGDEEVACMLLRDITADFARDGLIITPMLEFKDATCGYSLEFHADLPVDVVELTEAQMQSIAGRWGSSSSGGCHINPSQWAKNPAFNFHLIGHRPERAKVSVTLSRPSADWKKECLKDPVGSMIGFYITPIDRKTRKLVYQPGVTFQTDFVPMNEVSTPPGFYLEVLEESQSYGIVPCTYEPGKKGKFSLTVSISSSDSDFDGSNDFEFELGKLRAPPKKPTSKSGQKQSNLSRDGGHQQL